MTSITQDLLRLLDSCTAMDYDDAICFLRAHPDEVMVLGRDQWTAYAGPFHMLQDLVRTGLFVWLVEGVNVRLPYRYRAHRRLDALARTDQGVLQRSLLAEESRRMVRAICHEMIVPMTSQRTTPLTMQFCPVVVDDVAHGDIIMTLDVWVEDKGADQKIDV